MRNVKTTFMGFILFFITSLICIVTTILVYKQIEDKSDLVVCICILLLILGFTLVYTISDMIRRKIMIDKPLEEILYAADLMSKGIFKINLVVKHSYDEYDEFDIIKVALNNISKKLSSNEIVNNDFIANFSHEIKTPLSIIQNYSKLLMRETISEDDKKLYLTRLNNACSKLNDLVISILKLNKLDNQKIKPEIKKFNVSEKLIDTIIQYEDKIAEKNIELICGITENLFIQSEESYIKIVFNNLISNAVKFTDDNGVIKISLCNKDDGIEFIVEDNGCGMDSSTGDHIFDKFYQGDTSHSSEGNGLGLTLVKKVIDILGGIISVESKIGEGTKFTVVIKEN